MTEPIAINTGPCDPWCDADDITACCADLDTAADLAEAAHIASDLLYRLSGYQFSGLCAATVRPCASHTSCWQPLAYGWMAGSCACQRLSTIRLAGYPIRQIDEVLIDGETVDPSEYRLDRYRELVRLADAAGRRQTWPSCQRLDVASGDGTFFVSYTYGVEPPTVGVRAAAQLACEIAKACPSDGSDGECALPSGLVRLTRQGVTIETQQMGLWLLGSLRTGMTFVDAFLSAYGRPRQRRVAVMVPEQDPWPLRIE